jgi:hypothetical protein
MLTITRKVPTNRWATSDYQDTLVGEHPAIPLAALEMAGRED